MGPEDENKDDETTSTPPDQIEVYEDRVEEAITGGYDYETEDEEG